MDKKNVVRIAAAPIRVDNPEIIPDIKLVHEFLQFVSWKASPTHSREIKTQKEFAECVGVSQDTLTDWKKLPAFSELLWQAIRERLLDDMPDAINGLCGKVVAGKGGATDLRLLLNLSQGNVKEAMIAKRK